MLPVLEPLGDTRSDTRIFAEDILPTIGGVTSLDNDQIWNIMEDFTQGSKVVILTIDPRAKHQCYVLHENKGWKDASGVWWSNQSCFLYTPKVTSPYSYGLKDEDMWKLCVTCDEVVDTASALDGYCKRCNTCIDCNTYITDCLCFTSPSKSKKEALDDPWAPSNYHTKGGWSSL
jgi:glutamine amidotransferase